MANQLSDVIYIVCYIIPPPFPPKKKKKNRKTWKMGNGMKKMQYFISSAN